MSRSTRSSIRPGRPYTSSARTRPPPVAQIHAHRGYAANMAALHRTRYTRRPNRPVVAIRLALDTNGLSYRKWGGRQRAKQGDWIVDNGGDIYTIDAAVFRRTY